eukprot:MONOS_2691.1-p1 / transcript=MONOS_2691.1 / gene=MONOS_2691 / organism=Monocercomonoides_exilis_PA203 / gene_product=unspecified product / transcript_product=unspecified product / location=Mono_scaffold00056:147686-149494(-) / protein_length=603 / sequence_SO=supercontig / SO=protein_coding / is_pseudo=false
MTTLAEEDERSMLTFDLKELTVKGRFHMANEKILKLKRLAFDFQPFKTEEQSNLANKESSVILSRGINGDLDISDCEIKIAKWINEYAHFSILSVTGGKVSIDKLLWNSVRDFFFSEVAVLHISEGVTIQKLNDIHIRKVKLNNACAFELPNSFTLEGSNIFTAERNTEGPALLEAKSGEYEKALLSILKCVFSGVASPKSTAGGSFFFEMLHPESELHITDTTFNNGKAIQGGGVMIGAVKGKVILEKVKFQKCIAEENGGGLEILDLTKMNEFNCINGEFRDCGARFGSGVVVGLAGNELKSEKILFQGCFFERNLENDNGVDLSILCDGDAEIKKSPFDDKCFSTTEKGRVCIIKNDGIKIFREDWLHVVYLEVYVDGAQGSDEEECGKPKKPPCKTIKKAVEKCNLDKSYTIFISEESNKYDAEPIVIERNRIDVKNKEEHIVSITTALDEGKVTQGDALFNLKKKGELHLSKADIKVDTTRASGQNNGLFSEEGEGTYFILDDTNITSTDSGQALNCVLIESNSGAFYLYNVQITHFSSFYALLLAKASGAIVIGECTLDTVTTTSTTQSVITILSECKGAKFINATLLIASQRDIS